MGSVRSTWSVGGFAALLFHAVPTAAQIGEGWDQKASTPPADELETWLAAQRDASGRACNRRDVDALGNRWVIACGETGLWVARRNSAGAIELTRTDDLGGPVVRLFRREGRVWAEVLRHEARDVAPVDENSSHAAFPTPDEPVRQAPPAVTRSSPAPGSAKKRNLLQVRETLPEGHVTEVLLGEVVIDIGREHGLRHYDRVELSVETELEVGDERVKQRRVIAVGVVRAVSERFARIELGIDERVPLGAIARPTATEPSESRSAPPRLGALWHAGFMARPFVALNDLGGGILIDASVGYRFEGPLHVEAGLSPLGWGTGADKPAVVPVSAFVKASYDVDLFEVGFGLGVETVHDTPYPVASGSGALFVQQLRVGSLDGLNFEALSHAVLFHSEFRFASFVGRAQIPVGASYWLTFAGGGGGTGYGYGDLGVRALLRGNGDRGSFFLTITLGGAGVYENVVTTCPGEGFEFTCGQEVSYIGPTVGVGGEWRF
jgi:hypothetical protein